MSVYQHFAWYLVIAPSQCNANADVRAIISKPQDIDRGKASNFFSDPRYVYVGVRQVLVL